MSTEKKETFESATFIPGEVKPLLGTPPLLSSEDPELYWSCLRQVAKAVEPKDIIEWIWTKDIVDLCWEILRLRLAKVSEIERQRAIIASSLKRNGDTDSKSVSVATIGLISNIGFYEKLDKLLLSAEFRRDKILREMELRSDRLARRSRKASDEIIDGEFSETPAAAE